TGGMSDRGQGAEGLRGSPFEGFEVFVTEFTALNNSGVDGHALLFLDTRKQTLTVHIEAEGLEPGQVHAQHIHGFPDDRDAKSPTIAQDDDGDGFVELAEGLETYGPIQLNLTLNPEDSAHDHGTPGHDHTGSAMFPTADANGRLRYTETFRFDSSDPNAQAIFNDIIPLEAKEIVLHGLTLRAGQGGDAPGVMDEADGTAGYKGVLPVASGELEEISAPRQVLNMLRRGDFERADDWLFG
ncbi:MAG TPA: CHRD domain-containing protein, partial [Acetobacteraceae bacterium]|nr:CHRD domain-containing protein [Acetobacteraceae bacterium]